MKGNTEAGGLLIVLFAIVRETFVEGGKPIIYIYIYIYIYI